MLSPSPVYEVKKTESPDAMGDELPSPGSSVVHFMFSVLLQVVGTDSLLIPDAFGPRY